MARHWAAAVCAVEVAATPAYACMKASLIDMKASSYPVRKRKRNILIIEKKSGESLRYGDGPLIVFNPEEKLRYMSSPSNASNQSKERNVNTEKSHYHFNRYVLMKEMVMGRKYN